MDPNTKALIVYEGNKIRDDLLNKLEMLSYASSVEESELVRSSRDDVAIDANPLSYKLPEKSYLSYLKVAKNGSSSKKSIPNSRRSTIAQEEKYSENWIIEVSQRPTGRWDKEYQHKFLPVKCRSLKAVERFEIDGNPPPKRKGKGKKKESVQEEVRELVANEPEEAITIDMFLADARNNQLHLFSGHQNILEDLKKTPPPNSV